MKHLPLFVDLAGRTVLVVGGNDLASRKAALALSAGAQVRVVCPEMLAPAWHALSADGRVTHILERFAPHYLDGVDLVFAASGEHDLDAEIARLAHERHLPVNVPDRPEHCSFILPSIIDRSPIVVAVSSGGDAPVLARLLRARLESLIPAAYGRLAELAGRFRERVRQVISSGDKRRKFWEDSFLSPVTELVFSGREAEACAMLETRLQQVDQQASNGEVYLVGAGPGNPDLLTFRALRLMQQSDVVVYDRLVAPAILDMCRRDAEYIYVGKERDNHAVPQDEINLLLARLALQGKRVLRLKGGDPFIFGRGGEEIETLRAHHVPFQVVPAVTAAAGVASYAGIPLTHREHSQALVLVTGHLKDNSMDLDWDMLARRAQTVVIYMGLKGLDYICREMMAHGLPGDWPIAVVQQGTTLNQKVVIGTLADMPQRVAEAELKPPTLIIIGSVVNLHEKLAWFNPDGSGERATPLMQTARL
jgi:uroporphyrin-III C-methyltransferase/precorrin-2 dehydrogenase/sirohydrochlorin ferrochelatase